MPNWCTNEVTIIGDEEDLTKFRNFVKSEKEPFSFQSVMPIPIELKGTRSPTTIVPQEEYDSWVDDTNLGVGKPITLEMSNRFEREYGFDNWYDWQTTNWGTKWDVSDVEMEDSISWVDYKFETAWSPPEGIYNELTKLFTTVDIIWFYREDGVQIAGWL